MQLGNTISAVIAGGATGLGAAAAQRLAGEGCKIAILDTEREPGAALAARLGGIYCHFDPTNESSIDAALDAAREENGIERVLLNCFGFAFRQRAVWREPLGGIMRHDRANFERLLQANLTGAFLMAVKSAAAMLQLPPLDGEGARGIIINSASLAAEDGLEGQTAYAAAEGGIVALTRPMARDLLEDGIRVVTIMPGRVEAHIPLAGFGPVPASGMQLSLDAVELREFADTVIEVCRNEDYNGQCIRIGGARG